MKTNVEKSFDIEQPIEKVWGLLSDPTQVVVCVPGASITEKVDDQNYKGKVSLKFGPVKASYDGAIEMQELDHDNKKMVLKGKGLDSKGKGSAELVMNGVLSETESGTSASFVMDITITGKLAQFGARLINEVNDHLFKQFIQNFKDELSNEGGDEEREKDKDNTLSAGSVVGGIVKDKLGGIFGGKKEKEADS